MSFPGSTDSFTGYTGGETLLAANNAAQLNQMQAATVAIENKVGLGASTPTAGVPLVGTGAGTSAWQPLSLTTGVSGILPVSSGGSGASTSTGTGSNVLNNGPTLANPVETGGTYNTATLNSPNIVSPTTSNLSNNGQLNTSSLVSSGNITENGNPVWQYLGSATYTGGTVTSSGATPTLITGLSVLATVPTGATALKITIQLYNLYIQTGATLALLSVYSGATSGALTTQLGGTASNAGASGSAFGVVAGELITIIKSPTAGALYYSAAFSASSSNAKTDTASGTPALILVECC
jgi:hypothetical protein